MDSQHPSSPTTGIQPATTAVCAAPSRRSVIAACWCAIPSSPGRAASHFLVQAGLNTCAVGSAPQCPYAAVRPQSQAHANRQAICAKLY